MRISKEKQEKISEHILETIYLNSPSALFTSHISKEVARDEEFVKKILHELKKKKLVVKINKNPQGEPYLRRSRWRLSDAAYNIYKNHR
ncbi:MAG: hypothetical protein WDZ69_03270 [Candidatus Pacearchaeota archaeon]